MISSDLILRYLLGIIEPNQFGWSLIIKSEFIEYCTLLTHWIATPDKDLKKLKSQHYVPVGELIASEIARSTLASSYNVYDINESFFKQFFSATKLLDYINVFEFVLEEVTDDIFQFKQILRFLLSNTPTDIEDLEREKLKDIIIDREVNYKNLKNSGKAVPLNRAVDLLEFHNREELLNWLTVRKINYEISDFDLFFK